MSYQKKLHYQLRTIALIGDLSRWSMNAANKGGELEHMHPVHLYRLAETLTSLGWTVGAQGSAPEDVEKLLQSLEEATDDYPNAFTLIEGVREVQDAIRAYLALR